MYLGMRKLHHPLISEIEIENILYALGDPIRLDIVKNLAQEENSCSLKKLTSALILKRSCKHICIQLSLSKSTLSHHFKILREAGVIWCEKEGTQYVNRLRTDELNALFPGLLKSILKAASKPLTSKRKSS